MEDLPVPLSRVELYLAKACGMDVTVPEAPESRLEQYLAILAGDTSVEMPAPMSLTEQWLAYVLGVTPDPLLAVEGACYIDNQKVDVRYFAVAAGMPGAVLPPAPQNRKEQYWANIQGGGGGVLKYATGTNIALTDVVRGIEELQYVYGDTVQDGTPTPDAPVAVQTVTGEQTITTTGKNLWNPVPYSAGHYIRADGTIGNNTATSIWEIKNPVIGETYTITMIPGTSGALCVHNYDLAGNWISMVAILNNTTVGEKNTLSFTVPSSTASIRWSCLKDFTQAQLELGSAATAYEPYKNSTYTVGLTSKNLMPIANGTIEYAGVTVTMQDGILTIDGTSTTGMNIKLSNGFEVNSGSSIDSNWLNETITSDLSDKVLSITLLSGTAPASASAFRIFNNTTSYVKQSYPNGSTTTTFSNGDAASCFAIFIGNGRTFNNAKYHIQLETGATATSYQSYYNYELCKIGEYQDYIYKSGDDWYLHKEYSSITLNGSETGWTITAVISAYLSIADAYGTRYSTSYSNYFVYASGASTWGRFRFGSDNNNLLFPQAISTLGSLDDWKTWLSSHNPVVYYRLATPTDTKITDATLISQLNAVGSAVLPKPNAYIEVSADSTNLPGSLKISYYGEEE